MTLITNSWTSYIVLSTLTISVVGFYIWTKKRNFVKVGRVGKLFFYPVKSLKGIEITKGKCTKVGFEVNDVLDRSFMVVNEDGVLVSQREIPSLTHLTPQIRDNYLIINGPDIEPLKIEIKSSPSPDDKIITCKIHSEEVGGIDCGDEAAFWFQSFTKNKGLRLVRFYSSLTVRKSLRKLPFWRKVREKYPAGFQDEAALHLLSQASVDDLSSKVTDQKISYNNFRPNMVVKDCEPFAEDSWQHIKFNSNAELTRILLTGRCILTTNQPDTGILTQKEPLVTLRKYRIAEDPKIKSILGSVPCLGTSCAVISTGDIAVGDDIFAIVDYMPKMKDKLT